MRKTRSETPKAHLLVEDYGKRKPSPEYADFRFRAEVDWVEIKIRTKTPTNFPTVRRRVDAPYVETRNKGAGGASSEFWIKFYTLSNWHFIDQALENLTDDHPLAGPVEVSGIEIAVDAYSYSNDRVALAEMATKFYCGLAYPVSKNHRITSGTSFSTNGIPAPKALLKKINKGENIYIGNKEIEGDANDPQNSMYQHIYLKEVDRKKPLPLEKHRARIEINLKGIALPYSLLSEWKGHKFTEESKYFKFRKPKVSLSLHEKATFEALSHYGGRREKTFSTKRRIYSSKTQADQALNSRVYDALKNLTKRLSGRLLEKHKFR